MFSSLPFLVQMNETVEAVTVLGRVLPDHTNTEVGAARALPGFAHIR